MKYAALLALLLIGATLPQLLVHIMFSDTVQITSIEQEFGELPNVGTNPWAAQVLDAQGIVLAETTFDPYYIGASSEKELLDDIYVNVRTIGGATVLRIVDEQGTVRASSQIAAYCGDGVCQDAEEGFCEEDCFFIEESEPAIAELTADPVPDTFPLWKGIAIGGCALLVIALILLLLHMNRTKPNPVLLDTKNRY